MAYVFQKNGTWYIGFRDHNGKAVRKRTTFAVGLRRDEKAAEELARDAEKQAERVRFGQERSVMSRRTLNDVIDDYLEVEAKQLASYKYIELRLRKFVKPHLGKKLAAEVAAADVMLCLNRARFRHACPKKGCRQVQYRADESSLTCDACGSRMKARPMSGQTIQHIRNHISSVYEFAIGKRNELSVNPVEKVPDELIEEHDPVVITPECILPIINAVPDKYRGLFATAAYSGLRKGELCGLKWEHVDFNLGLITVARSHGRKTTKGKRKGHVPIHPNLLPYLQAELARKRSEYVFPADDGGRMREDTKLHLRMRSALVRAGIVIGFDHYCRRKGCGYKERRADDACFRCPKCTYKLSVNPVPPHWNFKDLRSTIATLTYEATNDLRAAQKLLRHRDLATTDKWYAKMRAARLADQLAKVQFPGTPQQLPSSTSTPSEAATGTPKVARIRRDS